MSHQLLQLQLFREIVMAIGNDLNMAAMLEEALQAYVRQLDLLSGVVLRLQHTPENKFHFEYLYSVPSRPDENGAYQAALMQIPEGVDKDQIVRFLSSTPLITPESAQAHYGIMNLPEFGLLILVARQGAIDPLLIPSLKSVNDKLAQSCIACQNNDALKTEILIRGHSEKSLAKSEERLRIILDAIQSGIIIIDASTHIIVDINPQATHMLGYTRNEIVGKECHGLICPALRGECPITDLALCVDNTEHTLLNNLGEPIPVLRTVAFVELNNREHLLSSFVDLREIKSAEEERDQLEKLLRQSQKMEAIGTLAGGIAHDFNNLLTPILGLTQLCLEEPITDPFLYENLKEINHAGLRARDLAKQILAFARQSDDKLVPIQAKSVIKETLKLIRSSLPTTIEIITRLETNALFMGSATHVQQIVMNLCTNAAHAMKESGGMLEVKLSEVELDEKRIQDHPDRKAGPYIELTVRDTGTGISQEISEAIFEPYFTTKQQNEGTGLGLALVHGLVDTCGGIIEFDTEITKGTTFRIYFPQISTSASIHPAVSKSLPPGSESILLVDDEPYIVKFGTKIFERLGYQVTTSSDSNKALALFKEAPSSFDLVFTDITMPGLTGDRLAAEILKIRPDIPIIGFTGYSDRISAENAGVMGFKAFLYKPMLTEELAKTVRRVLDESKQNLVVG